MTRLGTFFGDHCKQFYIIHHHFLPFPFKKVVCFFFFSRHPCNHTNCQGCSHRCRQSRKSGWRDRPKPGSRYTWIVLWHHDMLLHQHASNLEIKKIKWIFVDSNPPPRGHSSSFRKKTSMKSVSTFSPGREEAVPTFALPWSTDPPVFPTSIESTELQVLRDAQAKKTCQFGQRCYDVTMLLFSMWVVDAGPIIFALGSTMHMTRAWSALMLSLILCRGRLHNFTCEHEGWSNQATGRNALIGKRVSSLQASSTINHDKPILEFQKGHCILQICMPDTIHVHI